MNRRGFLAGSFSTSIISAVPTIPAFAYVGGRTEVLTAAQIQRMIYKINMNSYYGKLARPR